MTKAQLIAFEARIKGLWEAGDLPFLVHLSGGNEDQLLDIFREVRQGDWIFSTHRSHYHALLSGVPARRVEHLIRTGSSMFIYDRERNFFTSSVLGGTAAIAAGVAWQLKQEWEAKDQVFKIHTPNADTYRSVEFVVAQGRIKSYRNIEKAEGIDWCIGEMWRDAEIGFISSFKSWSSQCKDNVYPSIESNCPKVWCFVGDGAIENGQVYSAALMVDAHDLPCRFVIEDSGYQVDTPLAERRGGKPHLDNPLSVFRCVTRYCYNRVYPHAGSGCKHQITFNPEAVTRYLHGGNP